MKAFRISGSVSGYRLKAVFGYPYPVANRSVTREGRTGGEALPRKFFSPLEKCVGHNLKTLDIIQKTWAPLGKLFAPAGVPSWLRAWLQTHYPAGYPTGKPDSDHL